MDWRRDASLVLVVLHMLYHHHPPFKSSKSFILPFKTSTIVVATCRRSPTCQRRRKTWCDSVIKRKSGRWYWVGAGNRRNKARYVPRPRSCVLFLSMFKNIQFIKCSRRLFQDPKGVVTVSCAYLSPLSINWHPLLGYRLLPSCCCNAKGFFVGFSGWGSFTYSVT